MLWVEAAMFFNSFLYIKRNIEYYFGVLLAETPVNAVPNNGVVFTRNSISIFLKSTQNPRCIEVWVHVYYIKLY